MLRRNRARNRRSRRWGRQTDQERGANTFGEASCKEETVSRVKHSGGEGPSGGELKTGQKPSPEDVTVDLRSSLVITRGRGQRI